MSDYEKQTWVNGQIITQEKLNHIQDGIKAIKECECDPGYKITKTIWFDGTTEEGHEIGGDVNAVIYNIPIVVQRPLDDKIPTQLFLQYNNVQYKLSLNNNRNSYGAEWFSQDHNYFFSMTYRDPSHSSTLEIFNTTETDPLTIKISVNEEIALTNDFKSAVNATINNSIIQINADAINWNAIPQDPQDKIAEIPYGNQVISLYGLPYNGDFNINALLYVQRTFDYSKACTQKIVCDVFIYQSRRVSAIFYTLENYGQRALFMYDNILYLGNYTIS